MWAAETRRARRRQKGDWLTLRVTSLTELRAWSFGLLSSFVLGHSSLPVLGGTGKQRLASGPRSLWSGYSFVGRLAFPHGPGQAP